MTTNNNIDQDAPNLLNGTLSYDKIQDKIKEEPFNEKHEDIEKIIKQIAGYPTEETDMQFGQLANPIKLVDENDIKKFNEFSHNHEKHRSSDNGYSSDRKSHRHHSDHARDDRDHHRTSEHHRHDSSSDSEHYHNKKSTNETLNNQTLNDLMKDDNKQTPKSGNYGPSYGPGSSIPHQQVTNDKYEGFATEEELLLEKLKMLRMLGELATNHGVILSQNYNMASSYKSMKYEYQLHKDIRDKYNGTKWLGNLLCNLCHGIELGNEYFNPFDFKLKGWSQQMEDDKAEYYDVLAEDI